MTPDDWKQGIENEAASVEDAAWAREARRASQRTSLPQLVGWAVGLTAVFLTLMAGLNAVFIGYAPVLRPAAELAVGQALNPMWLVTVVPAFILTRRGARAAQVFAVMAGAVLLTSLVAHTVTLPVPPALPELSGVPMDLLPAPTGAPTTVALTGLAIHALMTGAGVLPGQFGTRRRASA